MRTQGESPLSFCNGQGTIYIASSRRTFDFTTRDMGSEFRYMLRKVLGTLSTFGLDLRTTAKNCRRHGPLFNHPPWQQLSCAQGLLEAPLDECVWFMRSFGCSLSWWRKVGLPLALWQESGPNFR